MTESFRIALYSGLFVKHDAISNSLGLKIDLLGRPNFLFAPVDATAFVHATDHADPRVVDGGVLEVLRHPAFGQADLHIFEFGIAYDLFDLIHLIGSPERVVVVYHNVTPLELVTDAWARQAVERARAQRELLFESAGHVVCDSEFSRDELVEAGLSAERVSVLHLPPADRPVPARAERDATAAVELLYVGRFVRSKGVSDLLDALEWLLPAGPDVRLTLVGSERFFDGAVMEAIDASCRRHPGHVRLLGEVDDWRLGELLAASDVLVIPSYHEGYCVPVVEAYAAGLQVVAYDSTNLPNVVGPVGQLVPTGDVVGLAEAIGRAARGLVAERRSTGEAVVPCGAGELDRPTWRGAVERHLADYGAPNYERRFRELLEARLCLLRAASTAGLAPA